MEDQIKQYKELITEVITEIGCNFSLEEVKDFFSTYITSKRSLGRVTSLRDIIRLLEKRDLLNCNKVVLLQQLGELLSNEQVKDLVHIYMKTCLDEETDGTTCSFCGISCLNREEPLGHNSGNRNSVVNIESSLNVDSDLCQALENVALNIGSSKWGALARELHLKEIHIDMCKATHPNDPVAQARMAFAIWCQTEKENANMDKLDKALEARLCQKFGFGIHLRKPVFGLKS